MYSVHSLLLFKISTPTPCKNISSLELPSVSLPQYEPNQALTPVSRDYLYPDPKRRKTSAAAGPESQSHKPVKEISTTLASNNKMHSAYDSDYVPYIPQRDFLTETNLKVIISISYSKSVTSYISCLQ